MAAPKFKLITELQTLHRRDLPLAAEAILEPNNANPLIEGEWLELDANYKLARGAGEGVNALVFPVHMERGRYDTQAIKKTNVLMLGMYEAESSVADLTGLAVGDALTVQMVTVDSIANRRGLKEAGATVGRVVVGFVSKIVGSAVRFVHYGNQKVF